jgi:hypothetical protein
MFIETGSKLTNLHSGLFISSYSFLIFKQKNQIMCFMQRNQVGERIYYFQIVYRKFYIWHQCERTYSFQVLGRKLNPLLQAKISGPWQNFNHSLIIVKSLSREREVNQENTKILQTCSSFFVIPIKLSSLCRRILKTKIHITSAHFYCV